jgi:hypothetical protein
MKIIAVACCLGFLLSAVESAAVDRFKGGFLLGANESRRDCKKKTSNPGGSTYGKNSCPCVGIDNIEGYFATTVDFYHVQYPLEVGASCAAWEKSLHPKCSEPAAPEWCKQTWCYIDPCQCELDVVPKQTTLGLKFQGETAYWSYATCGGYDFFTADHSENSCISRKDKGSCVQSAECGWDGRQCLGKEALSSCAAKKNIDTATYGREDCRCVGINGHKNGKAMLYIDDTRQAAYPPGVGASCGAWESDTHPDCLKDGPKPSWCGERWCYVDPCKCSGGVPPRTVMEANGDMRYQGKTVYWSYDTCGSKDEWSGSQKEKYCVTQTTEAGCKKLEKCAWTKEGKCIGRAFAEICEKQRDTGVLGIEVFSGSFVQKPFAAVIALLAAFLAI